MRIAPRSNFRAWGQRAVSHWRRMPLRLKLMMPVMAVCSVLVLVLFFTVWGYGTRSLENRLIGDANLLAHVVHSATESLPKQADLTKVLEQIQEDPSVNFVVAVDGESGQVIAASDPYTAIHADQVIPFWSQLDQRLPSEAASRGQAWYSFSKYQLQHISPFFELEDIQGGHFVLLALDTSKARKEVFAAAQGVAIAGLAALLTLSVAVAALLQGIVIRRVRKLIRSTPKTRVALQNYRTPLQGHDELCRLARSMSAAYRQLADNLSRQDAAAPAPTGPFMLASTQEEQSPTNKQQLIGKPKNLANTGATNSTSSVSGRSFRVDASAAGQRRRSKLANNHVRKRRRRIH